MITCIIEFCHCINLPCKKYLIIFKDHFAALENGSRMSDMIDSDECYKTLFVNIV